MDHLKMHTPNKADENFRKLAELFPNAVTETKNDQGEVVRTIDKDVLMQEINTKVVEGREERYQFTWPDKRKAVNIANVPIAKTLRPCREESVNFDTTENLYIEGDNLEVLKLLQETYLGKIKMIYIDPPYNTGKDFVYKDNYAKSKEEYLANSGQYDEEGSRLVQNTESNGRFHTDWLNMMYPRLKLARDLLTEDGVIFISIDDNEQENLKKICDEIFGKKNFVSNICVEISKTQGMKVASAQKGNIVKNHEYVYVYNKNYTIEKKRELLFDKAEPWDNHFNYVIEEENGTYIKIKISDYIRNKYPNAFNIFKNYGLIRNDSISGEAISKAIEIDEDIRSLFYIELSKKIYQEMACSISIPDKIKNKLLENDIIEYDKYLLTLSLGGNLRQYRNLYENLNVNDEYKSEFTRTTIRGALWKGFYSDMMNIAKEGEIDFKNGKKPVRLIKQLIKWANYKDAIILDFFSGSATTAHAVMQLNAEDGGNRKFIMVQFPEKPDEKSEAYKAGYTNICEIGKERIRRAAKKIAEENPDTRFDGGFRVLKCDSSNMKDVYYSPESYNGTFLNSLTENIKEDRTPEDLLFQVMLDLGILLSSKITETLIGGKKVFDIADGFLIACFDDTVTDEVVTEIAKKKPQYFVMRDSSLAKDSVAANFDQIFAMYSPYTTRKVL